MILCWPPYCRFNSSPDYDITDDLYKEMYGSSIQSGGFIGTLIASLAGSLLPSLLGGKGLYRAGTKPKKGGGLYRAGTKPRKKKSS